MAVLAVKHDAAIREQCADRNDDAENEARKPRGDRQDRPGDHHAEGTDHSLGFIPALRAPSRPRIGRDDDLFLDGTSMATVSPSNTQRSTSAFAAPSPSPSSRWSTRMSSIVPMAKTPSKELGLDAQMKAGACNVVGGICHVRPTIGEATARCAADDSARSLDAIDRNVMIRYMR